MNESQFLAKAYGEASGELLDDLTESHLETVIPSSKDFSSSKVMVLVGEFRGERGVIVDKDKRKEEVRVQLDEEAGLQIVSLSMDDVSQCI